ncbi:MAG: hypothetical protein D8H95_40770, partial [Lachnospiraceae bacterium]
QVHSWYSPPFAAAKAGRIFPFVNPQQRRAQNCQRKANIFRKKFLQVQKIQTAQGSRDRT